ncbi:MAG: ribonuclease R [bacterium]|nr:ribonuclease R [bacterium]
MAMQEEEKKEKSKPKTSVITGTIKITGEGVGYVESAETEEDAQIQTRFLHTALHRDTVEAVLFPQKKGERLAGEVTRVLSRAKTQFVGTVRRRTGDSFCFVAPDDTRMYTDIFVPHAKELDPQDGMKVLVEMTQWEESQKSPEGKILRVIGKGGEHETEMQAIVFERGLQIGFPDQAIVEARAFQKEKVSIIAKEAMERKDFRGRVTFTIDPEDAKDFDDALSVHKLSEDLYEVGVHIADVSFFVKEDTVLDKEAFERGFSLYLVDRTIPMLPEELSNDLCSLNPQEDKLAFSAVLHLTKQGEVREKWFGRTIINSNTRFTYEQAQKVLDEKTGTHAEELQLLNTIALALREERAKRGALDFDQAEVRIELNEQGSPIRISEKERGESNKLIEELMILANREVAEEFMRASGNKKEGAGIFRIHDEPKRDEIRELSTFLHQLGYELNIGKEGVSAKDLNDLFKKLDGRPEESLVKTVALKSMAKAIYSTKSIGHFGLALLHYTHFTSPIRRYADLLVHRLLDSYIKGRNILPEEQEKYRQAAEYLSRREMDVVDAERTSIAVKQIEYMLKYVGEVRKGVISGISNWGIYVQELETKAEGMVRLRDLQDDYYVFDRESYSIVGSRTKKRYTIADVVKIKIVGGSIEKRQLDFTFAP